MCIHMRSCALKFAHTRAYKDVHPPPPCMQAYALVPAHTCPQKRSCTGTRSRGHTCERTNVQGHASARARVRTRLCTHARTHTSVHAQVLKHVWTHLHAGVDVLIGARAQCLQKRAHTRARARARPSGARRQGAAETI